MQHLVPCALFPFLCYIAVLLLFAMSEITHFEVLLRNNSYHFRFSGTVFGYLPQRPYKVK